MTRPLVAALLVVLVPLVARADDKPKKKKPPIQLAGYTTVEMEGFILFVSDEAKAHEDDEAFKRKPREVLQLELQGICRVMPPKMLKVLQTVKIFVEWEDPESKPSDGRPGIVVARYWYDSGRGLGMAMNGRDPRKANNIEILNMRHLTEKWQPGKTSEQIVLLHELCHAVHSHLLGNKNPIIIQTYNTAMERGLYNEAKHESGRTLRPYAATNDHEYFAELSCAFLDRCAYYPFSREQLREHDPLGYKLMEQIWGTQDPRSKKAKEVAKTTGSKSPVAKETAKETPKKPATPAKSAGAGNESVAMKKLELIETLVRAKRHEKAREKLNEIINEYPGTNAAKKAQEMLDTLK